MRQTLVQVQEAATTPADRIMQALEDVPGLNIQEIADRVGASRSTVRHHIRCLADDRLVAVQRQGNHRLHFTASMPRAQRSAVALLRLGSLRSIMSAVMRQRSTGQEILFSPPDVAEEVGLSLSSVYRNLKALKCAGLARTARVRRSYRFWPHPELRLAWVHYCRNAPHTPPLRAAPTWTLGIELLLGKLALGDWATS